MLTDNFQLQPSEIIQIGGITYAVFFDTDEETGTGLGDFPILAKVDSLSFIKPGTTIKNFDTEADPEKAFADYYGFVYRGHEDLLVSQIPTITNIDQAKDYRSILEVAEKLYETKANEKGYGWMLDTGVQVKFLASALTGNPVSVDDLSDTDWYNFSTPEQRDFMAEFFADPSTIEDKVKANIAAIRNRMYQEGFKGDTNALAEILAYGVVSRKYTSEQVDLYLSFIADETFLTISGGEQLLPEELRPFVNTFETTRGQASARETIKDYLGADMLRTYEQNGKLLKYAGMINNGQGQAVNNELQALHDNMYPSFKGSKYSLWNEFYTNRASKIINGTQGIEVVDLSEKDKAIVNDLIIDAKGDYNEFDKLVRKQYKDAPGVKNAILGSMLTRVPQAVSGVF